MEISMAHRMLQYGTRMMRADGPTARALIALGRAREVGKTPTVVGRTPRAPAQSADDLPALRAEYLTKTGKKPFNGWDAATLKAKLAQA
jgi:hypothetical protein